MPRAKRADRIKLVLWDDTGSCLFAKRLEEGVFRWPKIEDGMMYLSATELSALLKGFDWRRGHAARRGSSRLQPDNCGPRCGKVNLRRQAGTNIL